MDSIYSDAIEKLLKDYPLEALMKADMDEKDRLEIIFKREVLEDLIRLVKEG